MGPELLLQGHKMVVSSSVISSVVTTLLGILGKTMEDYPSSFSFSDLSLERPTVLPI